MAARSMGRRRHVPQRTCVGCREVLAKRTLIRIVRTPDGVRIDPTGKAAGRGAYLHDRRACWEAGLQGSLARALKVEIPDESLAALTEFMNGLADDRRT